MSRYHPYKNNQSYGNQGPESDPSDKKDEKASLAVMDTSYNYLHNKKRMAVFEQNYVSFETISTDLSFFPGEISFSSYFTDNFLVKLAAYMVDNMFTKVTFKRSGIKLSNIIVLSDSLSGAATPNEVSSFVQQGKVILFPLTREQGFKAPGFFLQSLGGAGKILTHNLTESLITNIPHATRPAIAPLTSDDFRQIKVTEMQHYPHGCWNSVLSHDLVSTEASVKGDYQLTNSPGFTEPLPRGVYILPTFSAEKRAALPLTGITVTTGAPGDILDPAVPIKDFRFQQEQYLKDFPFKHLDSNTEYTLSGEREYHFENSMVQLKNMLQANYLTRKMTIAGTDYTEQIPIFVPWPHELADTKKVGEGFTDDVNPFNRQIRNHPKGGVHLITMLPIKSSTGALMKLRASVTVEEKMTVILEGEEEASSLNIDADNGPMAKRPSPEARYFPPLQVGIIGTLLKPPATPAAVNDNYLNNAAFFLS